MKIAALIYAMYLGFWGVDHNAYNALPDKCHEIEWDKKTIETAQLMTGHHNPQDDEHYELLEKKSAILECPQKDGCFGLCLRGTNNIKYCHLIKNCDTKYVARIHAYKKAYPTSTQEQYTQFMHCPELEKYISEHTSSKNAQGHVCTTDEKLFNNIQDQYNRLECDKTKDYYRNETK